jgi:CheY-like chemotaxis protein
MDDEEGVRDVAAEMLRCLGYSAETVRDGAEAVAAYGGARNEGIPFDAVILDLTVPGGMGGKQAVGRLLEIDPGARVIVSSGYSNDAVMAAWREHGFRAAVPKPYRIETLGTALAGVLRRD